MLHALLSIPTDGGEWLASQTGHFSLRRKYFKDSSLLSFDKMSLVSHSWHYEEYFCCHLQWLSVYE